MSFYISPEKEMKSVMAVMFTSAPTVLHWSEAGMSHFTLQFLCTDYRRTFLKIQQERMITFTNHHNVEKK